MKTIHAISLMSLAVLLSACASSGAASRSEASASRGDPNVITGAEIAGTSASTLYDAVRALRPTWLRRSRPTAVIPQDQSQLLVYVDGTRFGNIDSLRQLAITGIASVRYHSASSAEARFGSGHLLGAIEVTTPGH